MLSENTAETSGINPIIKILANTNSQSKRRKGKPLLTPEQRTISKLRRKAYQAWWNARDRTTNPSSRAWKNWGGRGITMSPEWAACVETFLADMGLPPSDKHSLDRINNDGHYEHGNCRWVLKAEQTRNTRRNIFVAIDGELMIGSEADRQQGWLIGTTARWLAQARKIFGDPEAV